MGSIWLHDLPAVIAGAGLDVAVWPGWETRARSTGGYDDVRAVGIHHDASPAGTSLDARCRYAWENADARPIGALWLDVTGLVVVGAAGATNTQGKGGPITTSAGTIPVDAGNRYMLSVEASNDGVGQPWPAVQCDAYVALVAALVAAYGLTAGDVVAHWEWTSRKIDPAGPSPWATGTSSWDMDRFRADVLAAGTPTPTPTIGVPDMFVVRVNRYGWPTPVDLRADSTSLRWTRNGNTAAAFADAGLPVVDVTVDELRGMLYDLAGTGPHPFGPGSDYADTELAAAW